MESQLQLWEEGQLLDSSHDRGVGTLGTPAADSLYHHNKEIAAPVRYLRHDWHRFSRKTRAHRGRKSEHTHCVAVFAHMPWSFHHMFRTMPCTVVVQRRSDWMFTHVVFAFGRGASDGLKVTNGQNLGARLLE